MFRPQFTVSNRLINRLSRTFLVRFSWRTFSMGTISRSQIEWPEPLKWAPTGAEVFSWEGWMIVPLWPRNLSLNDFFVSPIYCGLFGQVLPPLLHVIQYITFVELQVSLSLISISSPVAEQVMLVTIFFFSLSCSHTGHLGSSQGLKPLGLSWIHA